MISHVTLGTNNLEHAEAFYDQLLALMGGRQAFKTDRAIFYSFGENSARFSITRPYDGKPATHGNGTMVALTAASTDQVDAVHAKVLELGGTSEGEPGLRGDGSLSAYAAYFRDPEGNKFGIFAMQG